MAKKINIVKKEKKKTRAEIREEKKERMFKIIVGLVTAFLMASGILGYVNNSSSNSNTNYHGVKFSRDANNYYWITKINGKVMDFYYHPTQLEFMNVSPIIKPRILSAKFVLITFNPNQDKDILSFLDLTRFDVTNALLSKGVNVRNGVTQPSNQYNLSIITCNQSSQYVPVIYLTLSNETRIFINSSYKNCIVGEAESTRQLLAIRDRFLYMIYGIMD